MSSLTSEILVLVLWIAFLPLLQWALNLFIKGEVIAPFAARKISHVLVGVWVIPFSCWIHRWYLAAIPISMILAGNVHANVRRADLDRRQKRLFPLVCFVLPLVLVLFFWNQYPGVVVLAVLSMTLGDTAAALVGRHWGQHRIAWTGKTWEGAAANFIVSLLVMVTAGRGFYHQPAIIFVMPAAAVAVLETILPGEWDNPLSIVLLLILLRYSWLA